MTNPERNQILDVLVKMVSFSLQENDVDDAGCTLTWPYLTLHGYARNALVALARAQKAVTSA